MPFRKLLFSCILSAAVLVPAWPVSAQAQTYPDHPVRIIVPIGPGGAYDIIGRLLANKLTEQIGQSFFIENRTGAGTLVGTQAAAAAPADGYTLVVGGLSNIVFNFALYQKVPYEPDDFVPVALVYTFPYVMVARNDLPQKDLAEIISYGRQSPGKLTIAHPGVRGIALLAPQRYPKVPNLPTMTEAGLPGLGIESWIGLFAPARTPPEILARLRQETRIAASELKDQFEKSGGALMQMPVAETDKFLKSEFELWTKVIRDAGIRLD